MAQKLYRLMLWKAYFDKGFSLTNQLKYAIFLFGWATDDILTTVKIALGWAVCCFFIGKLWYRYLTHHEYEVQNAVNPFVQEMRKVYKH